MQDYERMRVYRALELDRNCFTSATIHRPHVCRIDRGLQMVAVRAVRKKWKAQNKNIYQQRLYYYEKNAS
jgi:hypothetical protein